MQEAKDCLVISVLEIFRKKAAEAIFLQPPVHLVEQRRAAQENTQAVRFLVITTLHGCRDNRFRRSISE